ncbi:MAG: tRNA (adenosine(37)-N6)-threonylcarbamoyltransferase complex transferase subunit TsaD [Crocinitomicaceae bacterium]
MTADTTIILGIESSCDDTSIAVLKGNKILANVVASQLIHANYGGVVPEIASRNHQEMIWNTLQQALSIAKIEINQLDGIAVTKGPGLLGSLLVGVSFAKGLSLVTNKPLLGVHHMKAHILAHFISDANQCPPSFPFLCLTVSGGHTQIVLVKSALEMEIIGKTIDDAAGEAFDKAAKMLGLPYPGGPLIDKHGQLGDETKYTFSKPKIQNLDFSFSGVKTSIKYQLEKWKNEDADFVENNLPDLCASIQKTIVDILIEKCISATKQTGIKQFALAGGVSANSKLRNDFTNTLEALQVKTYIPKFEYCTDNGAMIAMAGKFLYDRNIFENQELCAQARLNF